MKKLLQKTNEKVGKKIVAVRYYFDQKSWINQNTSTDVIFQWVNLKLFNLKDKQILY